MKNSDFRLQAVLDVRQYQERRLQNELFEIAQMYERELSALSKLNSDFQIAVFEESTIVRARADDFQTSKAFIETLSTQIDSQEEKMTEIKGRENQTRSQLLDKRQSKHMLENLKKTFTDKVKKIEDEKFQKIIDEFGNRDRKKIGE